ncbi:hypothetical protein [Streptomyces smyrnaeus]|uniref:hypothetical protein n=1 Tax=Streptomyces smyrnaeus TaxID=1387713 RepID=UPI0033D41058
MSSPSTCQHTILCEDGPETVTATEPVPGLLVYEVPDNVSVGRTKRWTLGTRDGFCIAAFATQQAALRAADDLRGIADWTTTTDELRALFTRHGATSLRARQLTWDAITTHGGHFSHLGTRPQ